MAGDRGHLDSLAAKQHCLSLPREAIDANQRCRVKQPLLDDCRPPSVLPLLVRVNVPVRLALPEHVGVLHENGRVRPECRFRTATSKDARPTRESWTRSRRGSRPHVPSSAGSAVDHGTFHAPSTTRSRAHVGFDDERSRTPFGSGQAPSTSIREVLRSPCQSDEHRRGQSGDIPVTLAPTRVSGLTRLRGIGETIFSRRSGLSAPTDLTGCCSLRQPKRPSARRPSVERDLSRKGSLCTCRDGPLVREGWRALTTRLEPNRGKRTLHGGSGMPRVLAPPGAIARTSLVRAASTTGTFCTKGHSEPLPGSVPRGES